MEELIKITENDGRKAVSARDLHDNTDSTRLWYECKDNEQAAGANENTAQGGRAMVSI